MTRCVEYKKLTKFKAKNTLIGLEVPSLSNRLYPLPIKKYQIQKNEVAYLSANTWDVSAGGNYGFNPIWVNRNNNIFDNLDFKPINEIKNLKNINELL